MQCAIEGCGGGSRGAGHISASLLMAAIMLNVERARCWQLHVLQLLLLLPLLLQIQFGLYMGKLATIFYK